MPSSTLSIICQYPTLHAERDLSPGPQIYLDVAFRERPGSVDATVPDLWRVVHSAKYSYLAFKHSNTFSSLSISHIQQHLVAMLEARVKQASVLKKLLDGTCGFPRLSAILAAKRCPPPPPTALLRPLDIGI